MSKEVKRYVIGNNGLPEFSESGEFVAYGDYDALRAERDELINAVEAFVHDDRVPNEVSQEFAEVLILSRRAALQGEQP